jgi:hypothetical protein
LLHVASEASLTSSHRFRASARRAPTALGPAPSTATSPFSLLLDARPDASVPTDAARRGQTAATEAVAPSNAARHS